MELPTGIKIMINDNLCIERKFVQVKFPKSKKKRIRKKWRKNRGNYQWVENHNLIKIGNDMAMVSTKQYRQLEQEFRKKGQL